MVYKSFIQRLFDKFQILFMCIGIVMIIVVTLFMLTDIDASESVLEMYESLNTTNTNNADTMKKLNFLASYIKETGDLKILMDVGLAKTEEEAENLLAGTQGNQEKEEDTEEGSKRQDLSGPLLEQANALKTDSSFNNSYYNSHLVIEELNGVSRVWESQHQGAWSIYKPYLSTMADAGCFFYATGALMTNVTGEMWTIEKIITALGGDVQVNGGNFIVTNRPLPNLNGGITLLNKILSSAGLQAKNVSGGTIDWDKVGKSKAYILYYEADHNNGQNSMFAGGGMHWSCLIDYDGTNGYQIGNSRNKNRMIISKSTYDAARWTFIFEVEY